MTTRRERIESRIEKREEWAAKAQGRAAAVFRDAEKYRGDIAFNTQPGHIPERARLIKREHRAFGDMQRAEHHSARAAGLERQLASSIFSDDTDATAALERKIAKLEATQKQMVAANAAIRRHAKAGAEAQVAALVTLGISAGAAAKLLQPDFCGRVGFADYETKNNGAEIRRAKKRLVEVAQRQSAVAAAEAAPNGVTITTSADRQYASIRFAEKPDRDVLDALRGAGWRWGSGAWSGRTDAMPEAVRALLEVESDAEPGEKPGPTEIENAAPAGEAL